MTISGVGSVKGVTAPIAPAGAASIADAPAQQAPGTDPGAGGDAATFSAQGASSLIGADGKVRTGWGLVDAPPVAPTAPGKLIEMKRYGDMEVPAPKPDVEGKEITSVELSPKPPETPQPLRKAKFSIITGPPQGDP